MIAKITSVVIALIGIHAFAEQPCQPKTPELKLAKECSGLDGFSAKNISKYIGEESAKSLNYCYNKYISGSKDINGKITLQVFSENSSGKMRVESYASTHKTPVYDGQASVMKIDEETATCFTHDPNNAALCNHYMVLTKKIPTILVFAEGQTKGSTRVAPIIHGESFDEAKPALKISSKNDYDALRLVLKTDMANKLETFAASALQAKPQDGLIKIFYRCKSFFDQYTPKGDILPNPTFADTLRKFESKYPLSSSGEILKDLSPTGKTDN